MTKTLSALLTLLALSSLAETPVEAPPPAAEPAAAAPAAPTAADTAAKFDELWKVRDDPQAIKDTEKLVGEALKAFGNDYEVLWRIARYRWWTADGLTETKEKARLGKEGWSYGERAVKLKGTGCEAKYYVALNIGVYSQAVGILTALGEGLEGKFNENLDYAIAHNETFDRYGGHTAKGRYYWELPWPKRDLKKSKEELQKSLAAHSEHLRNYLFLAQTLLKDGKAKEAKVEIEKALNGASDYDPPEARRVKRLAATVAQEIKKELE